MDPTDVEGRSIGEITTVDEVFVNLDINSTDVFLDIGSGRGNLVLACALRKPPPLLSCGIEIMPSRHEMAQVAASMLDEYARARVELTCGDALNANGLLERATKVFINNLLFDAATNASFARAMSPTRAPKLERVACTGPLADPVTAGKALRAVGLAHERTASVEANYAAGMAKPLYVYQRVG